uniref:Uncharacterized protein n=1 Tax=Rhizophora mucronata TaxID=61149 RepID=A0A2P2N3S5_RHIMU
MSAARGRIRTYAHGDTRPVTWVFSNSQTVVNTYYLLTQQKTSKGISSWV